MTRLRYDRDQDGNLRGKPIFAGREHVVVNIMMDSEEFNYLIISLDTGFVLIDGVERTLPRAKAAAKRALETLGVPFDDEVRRRSQRSETIEDKKKSGPEKL